MINNQQPIWKEAALWQLFFYIRDNARKENFPETSSIKEFLANNENIIKNSIDLTGLSPEQEKFYTDHLNRRYQETFDFYKLLEEPTATYEQILTNEIKNPDFEPGTTYWIHVINDVVGILAKQAYKSNDGSKIVSLKDAFKRVETEWLSPSWMPEESQVGSEFRQMLIRNQPRYMSYLASWISGLELIYYRNGQNKNDQEILGILINEIHVDAKVKPSRKSEIERLVKDHAKDAVFLNHFVDLLNDFSPTEEELIEDIMDELNKKCLYSSTFKIEKEGTTGNFVLEEKE